MKKTLVILSLVLVLCFFFLSSTDEESAIRAELDALQNAVKVAEQLHPLATLSQAKDISKSFILPLSLESNDSRFAPISFEAVEKFRGKIAQGLGALSSFEASYVVRELDIKNSKAKLLAKIDLLGSLKGRDDKFYESHLVEVELRKVDGSWGIVAGKQLENLRGNEEE